MYNDARIIAVSRNVERGILMRIAMLISMRPDGRCHINRIDLVASASCPNRRSYKLTKLPLG